MVLAREQREKASRFSDATKLVCQRFGWAMLASFGAIAVAGSYGARIALAPCVVAMFALAVIGATLFVAHVRAEFARMEVARAHGEAYRTWHRASERAAAERFRAKHGSGARCGCNECEADPTGFFGPFRKDGAP